jgi:prepilin-type N-terminal cleavage/methylation domain-containing protein
MQKPIIHSNKQSGFTLVEVIVVAVIVAILAGVSVPLYLGYINSSRTNQATNAAGSAASFVNACRNGGNTAKIGGAALAAQAGVAGAVLTCHDAADAVIATLTAPADIQLTVAGTSFTAAHSAGGAASAPFSFSP